jgi:uncharacterized Zn-binding protein involved in type VI secretion
VSSAPLFHPAKKGDRFSHDAMMSARPATSLIGALLGQALAATGQAGAFCAQVGAGASCGAATGTLSIAELLPRTSTGILTGASPTVLVAPGLGAALVQAHPVDCKIHSGNAIAPGTSAVLVQGFPLALAGGQTGCGALLCDGVPTILVGGPPASGHGAGTEGGSPIADAIAIAEKIADRVDSVLAAVQRGADLVEQTITETTARVEGAVSTVTGVLTAVTGALSSLAKGGILGVLTGSSLAGDSPEETHPEEEPVS